MYAAHHTFVLDPLQCDGHTYNNTLLLPTIKTKPVQTISIPSCLLQLTAIKQTNKQKKPFSIKKTSAFRTFILWENAYHKLGIMESPTVHLRF